MWFPTCILLLALGASAAPSPFKSCGPQNIVLKQVTDTWSLPVTKMDPYSTCTYSFQIPNGTFAEVDLSATGLGNIDTISAVGIQRSFRGTNQSYQLTTLSPAKFDVTIDAGQDSTMSIQFSVSLQKVKDDIADEESVDTNYIPYIIYLDEWRVGSSYYIGADTVVRLQVAFNGVNVGTQQLLNNIFIYDGENTPITLLNVEPSFYLAKNEVIRVYLAKEVKAFQGALYLIDNSNLEGILNYGVQFVPTDPSQPWSWVTLTGDPPNHLTAGWGAVTIVGKADGSTPIDVRNINIIKGNGTFYYNHGAPTPNHPKAKPFGKKDLPLRGVGITNTVYISMGEASFKYSIN